MFGRPLALLALLTLSGRAMACDAFMCFVPNVAHYDQVKEADPKWLIKTAYSYKTGLCATTTMAMLTQTMLNNHMGDVQLNKTVDVTPIIYPTNLSLWYYYLSTPAAKINAMAQVLFTDKVSGTSTAYSLYYLNGASSYFKNQWTYFPGGITRVHNDLNFPANHLKENLWHPYITKPVPAYVSYGHYAAEYTHTYLGYKFYVAKRNGGHAIAQAGYFGSAHYFFDPVDKHKYWTELKDLYAGFGVAEGSNYVSWPGGRNRVTVMANTYHPTVHTYQIIETSGSFGMRKY